MNIASVATLVATLAATTAPAQVFTQQSAKPTGRNLGGIVALSPTRAIAVGDNHHIVETTDGGLTWNKKMGTAYSTDPFYTITFFDSLHGYVAGNNQDAYRTVNGGATWVKMNSMLSGSVRELDFVTPTTGFAGYNGALSWTPDGGLTWQLRSGYPDCPIVYGMDFRDGLVGIIAGHQSTTDQVGLHRTTDGGVRWTCVLEGAANDVLWIDDSTVISVSGTDVIRSDDAGENWYIVGWGAIETGAGEIARAGATDRLGAVSLSGDIWISTDLGYSWRHIVEGIGILPATWDITFFDENNGWVCGSTGLVYRTTDGGETWTLVNNGCGDVVTALDFADDNHGIAVTNGGYVFQTSNAGATWPVIRLKETGLVWGRDEGLNAARMLDLNNIVVAGAGGVVFKSTDGGASWASTGWPWGVVSPYFQANTISFVDGQRGFMAGQEGPGTNLYRTDDGGWSWYEIPDMGALFVDSDFKGSRGLLCTGGSAIFRSTDAGDTWQFIEVTTQPTYFSGLSFTDENNGWVAGWYGYVGRSSDGGLTWTDYQQDQNENYLAISATSPWDVWLLGYDESTFKYFYKRTVNGGKTWTRTGITGEEYYERMHIRPSGRVWIGGMFGAIIHCPAPPLAITLPADTPRALPPGQFNRIHVRIVPGEQQVVPGSQTLWFRRSSTESYRAIPLSHVSGENYDAVVPPLACGDAPQFYFSATGSGGTTVKLPANAPSQVYSALVGQYQQGSLLSTDFESGLPAGWTATGLWHVTASCPPPGTLCGGGMRAYFGQDSGCHFNTGAAVSGKLTSPLVALPQLDAGQSLTMSYCHALRTQNGEGALSDYDQAQVWIVSGGTSASLELCVDRNSARTVTHDLSAWAGKSVRFEWRFDSVDALKNNFRGWHVDSVSVNGPILACSDACVADFDKSGFVDNDDFNTFVVTFEEGLEQADIDGSGFVDLEDFAVFIEAFIAGC
ncbi:MAG: YCF48-related protein [Phycisphaerales bacterium]|nr:YCF48-related protein [Phycisphaerales bacterium]